jgi:uncharacterized cupredoxin-like copper-binding protein
MRIALTVLAVGAAALAGCGGSDDGGGGGATTTVPAGKPVAVTATEYKFEPANIEVDASSGPIKITLKNGGAIAHDLRVEKDGEDVGGTPVFGPDASKTAAVALKPGSYAFICSVPGHEAQGMKGTLEVK